MRATLIIASRLVALTALYVVCFATVSEITSTRDRVGLIGTLSKAGQ